MKMVVLSFMLLVAVSGALPDVSWASRHDEPQAPRAPQSTRVD